MSTIWKDGVNTNNKCGNYVDINEIKSVDIMFSVRHCMRYNMLTGRYHWSNCAFPARFFKINAVASLPWLSVVLHPSWTTACVALVVTGALIYIETIRGMTVSAFLRAINVLLTGRVKSTGNLKRTLSNRKG